ncbi:hypothetical protein [Amycolatopsis azurea]|uniref:hypothetical protein n=1 Tax=Amycolatopsis azurea TaxID=36819 RepID=UPI00058740CD|nr:hypothetical protein [Amycolatopsis azurea]
MLAIVVNHDRELDCLEQRSYVVLRRLRQVQRQTRKRIDELQVVDAHRLGCRLVRLVQLLKFRPELLLIGGQVVVAASQCRGERIIRVTLLRLLEDRRLFLGNLCEPPLNAFSLGVTCDNLTIVDSGQIGFENGPPIGPEHSIGEELRDSVQQRILTEVQRLLMLGEPIRATSIVVAGPAQVVRPLVTRNSDHPPAASMKQAPAEQIAPDRVGMRVRFLGTTGALLRACLTW